MVSWSNSDGPEMDYGSPDWRWRSYQAGSPMWAHDERNKHSAPLFGPELALGQALSTSVYGKGGAKAGERFGLVKVAVSGTSLRYNWTATTGDLYKFMVMRTKQALVSTECAGQCRVKALVWVQGEKDSNLLEDGQQYEENLAAMVAALREALQEPELFVVIAELGVDQCDFHKGADAVRAAQRQFVEKQGPKMAALASGEGLTWMDGLHYDTQGQVTLGRRIASAYINSLQ